MVSHQAWWILLIGNLISGHLTAIVLVGNHEREKIFEGKIGLNFIVKKKKIEKKKLKKKKCKFIILLHNISNKYIFLKKKRKKINFNLYFFFLHLFLAPLN
jgi:hypothetical protein